jgi:uncharacterized membrane protein YeaQ/YmgE (transglycosylase-associated protein family)
MLTLWMMFVGLAVGIGGRQVLGAPGFATPVVVALAGSFAAGLFGRFAGWLANPLGFPGFAMPILGAVVALAVYGFLARRPAPGAR